jgi:hypothetical protein
MGSKNSQVIKNKNHDANALKINSFNIPHYKEIIVIEDFEIENGVLGLHRDIYLSLVQFLDSPIVRKV